MLREVAVRFLIVVALGFGGPVGLSQASDQASCPPIAGAPHSYFVPGAAADGKAKLVLAIPRDRSSIEAWLQRGAALLRSISSDCRIADTARPVGEIIVNFDPCSADDGCFQIVLDRIAPELDASNILFYGAFSGANPAGAADLVRWCDAGAAAHYRAFCEGATARFCRSPKRDARCD